MRQRNAPKTLRDFPQRLEVLYRESGMPLNEWARAIGVTVRSLKLYRSGECVIPQSRLALAIDDFCDRWVLTREERDYYERLAA